VKSAVTPENEAQRLACLESYGILDTLPDRAFDHLVQLAARCCETPIALINFIAAERQWTKAQVGWALKDVPREDSFCAHTILQDEPLVVRNLGRDTRFANNSFIKGEPKLRCYAGVPLIAPEGVKLGTLCVFDHKRRRFSAEQIEILSVLAQQVMAQLELRRQMAALDKAREQYKLTEDRLRTSEAFYQTLVDTLPQNILRKDVQGRFTFANKKFCHSVGKPLSEILGKTDFDFFPRELALKYQRDDARVMSSLENLDTVEAHVTPTGEKLFVHVIKTPLYDSLGRVVGIQGIFWDVTQRKKIEEQLAYERDLLRALLDNIPDRIYFKDVHSRFIRCSASMVKRLGAKQVEDVVGKTDFDFHPRELAQEFFEDEQRIILTGQPLINKLERQVDTGGNDIWATVTKVPIYNQNGAVTGIIGISRDVTQLKKAEEALEQARDEALESARVKSRFLANMSHEIRTPMYSITGMTGLLIDTKLSQEQREYVQNIRDSTESLLSIINDILDFSKIEAGKLSFEVIDFELRESIENTVEMLADAAQRKRVDLNCWIERDVPNRLCGDPGRFRQVLANLLANAVKFTEKGEVLVHVTRVNETDDQVTLRFAVSDTGVGIEPKAMSLIFQPFTQGDTSTTRKFGGTGLGLTISKQIIELMKGEIGVESAAGKGSLFWFHLPFQKQPGPEKPPPSVEDFAGASLLVAEPHETSRTILSEMLGRLPVKLAFVQSADECLNALRASRPDVVLLDISRREFEDLSVIHSIKGDPTIAAVKVLVLAPMGTRLDPALLRSTGIAAYMMKPLRQARLYECLRQVIKGSGSIPQPRDASEPAGPVEKRNARVLLAEDNPVNQKLTLRQLKKLGFHAEAVANGREVLQALTRVPYDIILMDCQMPEMDGYETARAIRRQSDVSANSPYIIALTANAMLGDRDKCLGSGMNDYLPKPLDVADLEGVLERALAKLQPPEQEISARSSCLDQAVIAGLRELRDASEPDSLKELAELFIKDARTRITRLERALADKDGPATAATAHTLKGSANNLGARHLAALCASLEKAGKALELPEAANILLEVKGEFQKVEEALREEMER
jgi:two-component system, sensor histidine kinase and response regulator